MLCRKCGQEKENESSTKGICVECEKAMNNRYSMMHHHHDKADWMQIAKESSLELWERQPGETQLEWSIWQTYRDSYPGKTPRLADIPSVVDTTLNYVRQTSSRWNFQVRMQAWITYCDRITLAQRRQEVLEMNAEHIEMAQRLRAKLSTAINSIDPTLLKPSDLNSLLRTVTELENKARLSTIDTESSLKECFVDNDNPDLKKSPTQQSDLSEVVSILLKAGALGDITTIGVKQTTEVVLKED